MLNGLIVKSLSSWLSLSRSLEADCKCCGFPRAKRKFRFVGSASQVSVRGAADPHAPPSAFAWLLIWSPCRAYQISKQAVQLLVHPFTIPGQRRIDNWRVILDVHSGSSRKISSVLTSYHPAFQLQGLRGLLKLTLSLEGTDIGTHSTQLYTQTSEQRTPNTLSIDNYHALLPLVVNSTLTASSPILSLPNFIPI